MQLPQSVNTEIEFPGFVCFVARYCSTLKKKTDRDASDSVIGLCRIMELSDQHARIGAGRRLNLHIDEQAARLVEHLPDGGTASHALYERLYCTIENHFRHIQFAAREFQLACKEAVLNFHAR